MSGARLTGWRFVVFWLGCLVVSMFVWALVLIALIAIIGGG